MATSDILLHGARLGGDTGVEKAAEAKTLAHDAQVSADLALSETDQIILDLANKEPAITVGTANDYFRGDKTWRDFGTDVKATVLSGLSLVTATAVSASDSVVGSIGKLQAQISNLFTTKADKATDLAGYGILDAYTKAETYNKTETDSRIQAVIGSAPAALDTLQELAAQLSSDESAVSSLTNTVSQKADKAYVDSGLASKEPSIVAGTNSQYWRGDKSWRDLATDVIATVLTGLSTLTATAVVSTDSLLVAVGKLQAQINAHATSIAGKENTIIAGTTSQYYRGDKTWVSFATSALAVALAGLSTGTSSAVVTTDSILIGIGKLQAQINNIATTIRATVLTGLSTATSTAIVATDSILVAAGKLQAQITTLTTTVLAKADTTTVNSALALKADKGISLSDYGILDAYTMTQTDSRIQAIVGAAPAALDTLVEIAAQLTNDESAVSALTSTVAGKEPAITAGTTAQYWRGDKTWQDLATFVRATVLTGLSTATNAAVTATDTALAAFGKLQAQINAGIAYVDSAIVTERSAVVNLLNKTLISPIIKNYTEYSYSANVSGAVTIDLNNGTLQELTLTANTTFTLPASVAGKSYTLIIGYNGAFIPSFTGGSTLKWSGQAAPPAKSTAGFFDIFVFTCDGTITFGRSGGSNF